MSATRLGDLAIDIHSGFACGEEESDGLVQFRMNNVSREGRLDWSKLRRIPRSKFRTDLQLLPGDILFNATNSPELVGKTALFTGFDEAVTFSNHFIRLRLDDSKAEPRYVARWLQYLFTAGVFAAMCRRWVNQASVTSDQLRALVPPLPPLNDQRRIATILDQAEDIQIKRRLTIDRLSSTIPAIFLAMFGDPVGNPMQWPRQLIRDLGRVITGNTPPRANKTNYGSSMEWIKSDNINTPGYYVTKAHERLSDLGVAVGRVAPPRSILVTCIAGSPDCIGNSAMTDREVAFNQQINAFVPKTGNPHFYYAQFIVGKRLIQNASTEGMKGLVSKSRFEAISLIAPPIQLQDEFASCVDRIEALKSICHTSMSAIDELVASLQHQAFAGSLNVETYEATLTPV